jgi:hypothetical protein
MSPRVGISLTSALKGGTEDCLVVETVILLAGVDPVYVVVDPLDIVFHLRQGEDGSLKSSEITVPLPRTEVAQTCNREQQVLT